MIFGFPSRPRHMPRLPYLLTWILAAAVSAQDFSLPGPYQAGQRAVIVTRNNSTTFTAQLYYPATAPGLNTPFDPAAAPCAGISFGHGFLQTVDRYQSTLAHLATWGYVVIASESEGSLFPSHANFALDMRQCLTYLEQQNALSGSLLFGRVNTDRFGMTGHSMGGGCSILATAADARVRALAPLAAANTNPSAIAQMPGIAAPTVLICGSADSIVPVGTNGQLMYNASLAPRQLPVIQGGWHCGFEDVSTFGCDSGPLARADQLAITRRLLTAFFNLHLKNDQSIWSRVWGPERDVDPRVLTAADPRATLGPVNLVVSAFGGKVAQAQVDLTNGDSPESFTQLVSESLWPATLTPGQIGPVAGGASEGLTVRVQVPTGYQAAQTELILSSRRDRDGATRAYLRLTARRLCQGDFDQSGLLNINDFVAFINAFAAQSPSADVDNSGLLNINDFIAFLNAYATGC